MKVVLRSAISLNGIIARENMEDIRKAGCMIWGRKTHEVVKTWGKEYLDDLKGIRIVVISSDENYEVGFGFELAHSPKEALAKLEKENFREVILPTSLQGD